MTRAYFDVPSDIVECATKLRTYFDERNIKDWALDGVCALPQPASKLVQRVSYNWSSADVACAFKEGWRLAERDDGFLEIKTKDGNGVFGSDIAAQAFVRDRASKIGCAQHHYEAWKLHATRWYK